MRGVPADTGRKGVGASSEDALRLSEEKGPDGLGVRGCSASECRRRRDVSGEGGGTAPAVFACGMMPRPLGIIISCGEDDALGELCCHV